MKWLLILAVLGTAAFFGVTYYTNRFNALKDKAGVAKRNLYDILQKRIELIKKLNNQLSASDSIGKNAVASALRLADKATITQNLDEFALLLDEKNKHLERAFMQLRNPNLTKNAEKLNPTLEEITDNTRKIQLARREYNDHARDYNTMIQTGAGSFVSQIMKYENLPIIGGLQD